MAVAAGVVEPSASVVGRYFFYNQSYFDSGSAAANPQDDNAIDPTKRAAAAGGVRDIANVSSYTRGLNGVMFDLKDMPVGNQPPNVVVKVGVPGPPGYR